MLNEAVTLSLMHCVCPYKKDDVLNEVVLNNDVLNEAVLNEGVLNNDVLKTCVFLLKTTARLHHTETRIGDAPKHNCSMKSVRKSNKSGNRPSPSNHTNYPLCLNLH